MTLVAVRRFVTGFQIQTIHFAALSAQLLVTSITSRTFVLVLFVVVIVETVSKPNYFKRTKLVSQAQQRTLVTVRTTVSTIFVEFRVVNVDTLKKASSIGRVRVGSLLQALVAESGTTQWNRGSHCEGCPTRFEGFRDLATVGSALLIEAKNVIFRLGPVTILLFDNIAVLPVDFPIAFDTVTIASKVFDRRDQLPVLEATIQLTIGD